MNEIVKIRLWLLFLTFIKIVIIANILTWEITGDRSNSIFFGPANILFIGMLFFLVLNSMIMAFTFVVGMKDKKSNRTMK